MSITSLIRPEIRAMHAYDAAEQVDDTIRLNANESPRRSTIGNYRRPLNRYPEVRPQKLQRALAERFGCNVDELLVTRGSSEARKTRRRSPDATRSSSSSRRSFDGCRRRNSWLTLP